MKTQLTYIYIETEGDAVDTGVSGGALRIILLNKKAKGFP